MICKYWQVVILQQKNGKRKNICEERFAAFVDMFLNMYTVLTNVIFMYMYNPFGPAL